MKLVHTENKYFYFICNYCCVMPINFIRLHDEYSKLKKKNL